MNNGNIILTGGPAHIPAVRSRGLALGRRTMALLILVIGGAENWKRLQPFFLTTFFRWLSVFIFFTGNSEPAKYTKKK